MYVRVSLRLDNRAQALLTHGKEDMSALRSSAGINGDAYTSVGRVFEAGGHGEGGGEFAVNLGFGGACANGAPGHEVGAVFLV